MYRVNGLSLDFQIFGCIAKMSKRVDICPAIQALPELFSCNSVQLYKQGCPMDCAMRAKNLSFSSQDLVFFQAETGHIPELPIA